MLILANPMLLANREECLENKVSIANALPLDTEQYKLLHIA